MRVAVCVVLIAACAAFTADPIPDAAAVVRTGHARFTVLTDRLVRMEYDPLAQFEDRATYSIINRRLPVPSYNVTTAGDAVTIATHDAHGDPQMVLTYTGPQPFDSTNLRVAHTGFPTWVPGMTNSANLHGAKRSLPVAHAVSMVCKEATLGSCTQGVVSRDGWVLFDDASHFALDSDGWITHRVLTKQTQDWYFFGHGHDYRSALADLRAVSGEAPLPPRWALGVWWTRYWPVVGEEIDTITEQFRLHRLPLDVHALDMGWHYLGEAGKPNWGGYTWSPQYWPRHKQFLEHLRDQGIHYTLDIHPGKGVGSFDAKYKELARAIGMDPSSNATIPFNAKNKTFIDAMSSIVLDAVGVDFWWLDGSYFWSTTVLYEYSKRRPGMDGRGLCLAGWSGIGTHRYPAAFTGDVIATWDSLRFVPAYMGASANVMFQWGNEVGGHRSTAGPVAYDKELVTRWAQWGIFGSLFMTGPMPDPFMERRPWAYPMPYQKYLHAAWVLRAQLVPHLYTAMHLASGSGVVALHPLYYDWPELPGAYLYNTTFLFGEPALFVAPALDPVDNLTQLAAVPMWVPPGRWIDTTMGDVLQGPVNITRYYTLGETPVFAPVGMVLPLAAPVTQEGVNPIGSAGRVPAEMRWEVWHGGESSGAGHVYEDDASTGSSWWLNATYNLSDSGSGSALHFGATGPAGRSHTMVLHGAWPVASVTACPGTSVLRRGYDGAALTLSLTLQGNAGGCCVDVTFDLPLGHSALRTNYVGIRRRALDVKEMADDILRQPTQALDPLVIAVTARQRITYATSAADVLDELSAFSKTIAAAVKGVQSVPQLPSNVTTIAAKWLM